MVFVKLILCGYKTWSLALRKERRLRVFESGMLRRMFGPIRDEVTMEWRQIHNEELYDLDPQNIIRMIRSRKMRKAGHVSRMGDRRCAYRVLVVRHEGKRLHGKPRRGWEDDIKIGFQEVGWGGTDWMDVIEDGDRSGAHVNAVMNLWLA